ncbi:hemerythrin domain-containing protein [Phenylobacterium sp. VNQ135]|uniref:hemerythrin domain-containing protein n=1 Tax=Phenylobacterium sp. VNQ135 TaxID=3400922 RepID=UPI003C0CBD46
MPNLSNGNFGRLATGAALGFAAGLALPHARKAVAQGPSIAAGDWVEALKAEHRLVEKTFEMLLQTTEAEPVKRQMLLTKIAYALTKHAVEEENVIYPAMIEAGREDQARHLIEDHGDVKTFIYELRRMPTEDPRWIETARRFFADLQEHVREEEDDIFPTFRAALPDEENARLTRMMNWEGFKVA